jgi:hypothetical protein
MDALFAKGVVELGGPFADRTGSMVILEAENATKEWTIFLDARNR